MRRIHYADLVNVTTQTEPGTQPFPLPLPPLHTANPGRAILTLVSAWCRYADIHEARFDAPISEDQILGEHWRAIGEALRGFLNGPTGDIDCGTLDSSIKEVLARAGFKVSE